MKNQQRWLIAIGMASMGVCHINGALVALPVLPPTELVQQQYDNIKTKKPRRLRWWKKPEVLVAVAIGACVLVGVGVYGVWQLRAKKPQRVATAEVGTSTDERKLELVVRVTCEGIDGVASAPEVPRRCADASTQISIASATIKPGIKSEGAEIADLLQKLGELELKYQVVKSEYWRLVRENVALDDMVAPVVAGMRNFMAQNPSVFPNYKP